MSIDLEQNSYKAVDVAAQIKGSMFTLTTVQIFTTDIDALRQQLIAKIQQAPNFFHNAPIVLDLKIAQQPNALIDFIQLKQMLQGINLIPVGIKSGTQEQMQAASNSGLAILRDTANHKKQDTLPTTTQVSNKTICSKIITEPVRSGQQIYAPDGDLIIMNHVGHGAELIADGHIHVYGALRGRALAGMNGNQEARIFCQSLEAELVSVAGNYTISEDIEKRAWKIPAQIYIKDDRLQIMAL